MTHYAFKCRLCPNRFNATYTNQLVCSSCKNKPEAIALGDGKINVIEHVPCDWCSSFDFSCTGKCKEKNMSDDTGVEQVERKGKDMKLRADVVLEDMAELFRQRNIKYGDNWEKVGHMFVTMFPDGLTLKTYNDFVKFHFLSWVIGKFSRWVNNGMNEADDSLKDAAVYIAMIQAFAQLVEKDDQQAEKENESKGNSKPNPSRKTESTSREQALADPPMGSLDWR